MRARILTALVGIPLVAGLVLVAPPWGFGLAVLALAAAALAEYLRLFGIGGHLGAAVLAAGTLALAAVPGGRTAAAAPVAGILLVVAALWRVGDPARRVRDLAAGALGAGYLAYGLGVLWPLRQLPGGAGWILFALAATWAGDSAAYFAGTRWGRRRLAPTLSPNKTWLGAFAGLAGSLAGGGAAYAALGLDAGLGFAALAAVAVGAAGQVGDLFESLWKRAAGVKDSGALFPGHGGVLDRIDSLLLAFPVLFHLVGAGA